MQPSFKVQWQRSKISQKHKLRGSLEGGRTRNGAAEVFGVSRNKISRLWNRFLETGGVRR